MDLYAAVNPPNNTLEEIQQRIDLIVCGGGSLLLNNECPGDRNGTNIFFKITERDARIIIFGEGNQVGWFQYDRVEGYFISSTFNWYVTRRSETLIYLENPYDVPVVCYTADISRLGSLSRRDCIPLRAGQEPDITLPTIIFETHFFQSSREQYVTYTRFHYSAPQRTLTIESLDADFLS